MQLLRKDKNDEDEGIGSMFANLDQTAVLQEARLFNVNQPNSKKCIAILTKILVLLSRGVIINRQRATETFFAITKLFQLQNQNLRKILYIVIKELSPFADDVIILTSSLTKDMTGSEAAFRAPAIRTLCKITDHTMIQTIERYLKQAIVDKSPAIASAVLASAYHLMQICPDIIRKWSNEVQEAANGPRVMVQYHALGLLYHIRRNDRLAILKLIQKFMQSPLRSNYAHCIMIRIVGRQIDEEGIHDNRNLMDFLESSLRHKSEMVIYEAARAIISLNELSSKELAPAVSVLQLFCSSHKSSLRYAAAKTLNMIATRHPSAVAFCNLDLETLISDQNRSIATLAITTLLKTGSENNVDRLLKHICSFMADITDEFKVVVLESIRLLASKYPRKYTVLLNFLSNLLRDTAGYEFKKAVVMAMESIVKENSQAKNLGLLQLCEFIEDCEHEKLTQRILYLLGREGPFLKRPRQFIRFIYNRIILESAMVKCTATTALARFGANCKDLLPSVLVLLERVMLDDDDEVRDRASFYRFVLSSGDRSLVQSYILQEEYNINMIALERSLLAYTQASLNDLVKPFDLFSIPIEEPKNTPEVVDSSTSGFFETSKKSQKSDTASSSSTTTLTSASHRYTEYVKQLDNIPDIKNLGQLFKSSSEVELTDAGTEYVVTCVKHTFPNHIVFHYECTNTMEDQLLENVMIEVEPEDDEFVVVKCIPCQSLSCNTPNSIFVIIRLPDTVSLCSTTFTNTLKYILKDVNSAVTDKGLNDEYALEELTVSMSDHIQKIVKTNFAAAWEELSSEVEETYFLTTYPTIQEMVTELTKHLGMQPCERTDKLSDESKPSHVLMLAGLFRGGITVLAKCKMAKSSGESNRGINLQIIVRSSSKDISQAVADSLS